MAPMARKGAAPKTTPTIRNGFAMHQRWISVLFAEARIAWSCKKVQRMNDSSAVGMSTEASGGAIFGTRPEMGALSRRGVDAEASTYYQAWPHVAPCADGQRSQPVDAAAAARVV
eukprot:6178228-Pleurochrysis_carterae.AAC.1